MTDSSMTSTVPSAQPNWSTAVFAALGQRGWLQLLLLFGVCFGVLRLTMVPTVYTLDSAELVTASATLGFVHAPSYPLYLMVAHLFTLLPVGDVFFRVTLFTAVCLALSVCGLYSLVYELRRDALLALGAALIFAWSYYVWMAGLFPEIYAPQLLTISLCAWWLARMARRNQRDLKTLTLLGILVGITVALSPQSALLGLSLVIGLRLLRISWRNCFITGAISVLVFLLPLLYFPLRFNAQPAFNALGVYDSAAVFTPVPLNTLAGVIETLRGTQFAGLFFAEGFVPTGPQISALIGWLWSNFLGVGLLAALVGSVVMAITARGVFWTWCAALLPYLYFYTTYGAMDRQTMFGPVYLLLAVAFAYGIEWLTHGLKAYRGVFILALPLLMLAINFPLLNLSGETRVRTAGELLLAHLPANADVLGSWYEIFPLQYLQTVEGQRPDVRLYPTFAFQGTLLAFINRHYPPYLPYNERDLVLLEDALVLLEPNAYRVYPMRINTDLVPLDSPITGAFRLLPVRRFGNPALDP